MSAEDDDIFFDTQDDSDPNKGKSEVSEGKGSGDVKQDEWSQDFWNVIKDLEYRYVRNTEESLDIQNLSGYYINLKYTNIRKNGTYYTLKSPTESVKKDGGIEIIYGSGDGIKIHVTDIIGVHLEDAKEKDGIYLFPPVVGEVVDTTEKAFYIRTILRGGYARLYAQEENDHLVRIPKNHRFQVTSGEENINSYLKGYEKEINELFSEESKDDSSVKDANRTLLEKVEYCLQWNPKSQEDHKPPEEYDLVRWLRADSRKVSSEAVEKVQSPDDGDEYKEKIIQQLARAAHADREKIVATVFMNKPVIQLIPVLTKPYKEMIIGDGETLSEFMAALLRKTPKQYFALSKQADDDDGDQKAFVILAFYSRDTGENEDVGEFKEKEEGHIREGSMTTSATQIYDSRNGDGDVDGIVYEWKEFVHLGKHFLFLKATAQKKGPS